MALKKIFAYLRVSGPSQVTNGYGLERQREDVECWAHGNGYEIIRCWEDQWTGKEADRPAFLEMLEVMLADGVKVIVVERLDRLSRDLMVQCALLAKLCSAGITLYAADTGENVTEAFEGDPMRRALVQIQGVFAELDRRMLVAKLRRGKEAARAKGLRTEGPLRFGLLPGEGGVLQRMKEFAAKNEFGGRRTMQAVADVLNEEGHQRRLTKWTAKHGRRWTAGTVWAIMQREQDVLLGRKRRRTPRKRVNDGQKEAASQ